MTLIDFGDFKIRFDPKEVRISIDGEMVDVGARKDYNDTLIDEETMNRTKVISPEGNTINIDGNTPSGKHIKELISGQKSP